MVTLVTPVKVGLYHAGTITMLGVIHMSPLALSGDCTCIRIQQDFVFIKTETFLFIIRTIQSIGVLKFFDIQIKDDHRIAESDPVTFRKWNHGVWFFGFAVKQQKLAGGSTVCMNRKLTPPGIATAPNSRKSGADLESIDGIDWLELFGYYWHTEKLLSKLYSSNLSITLRK